jgi:hypothetical protein
MEKRYQVFVSSTYADLKEERRKVIQTLMELDCIPAGMELFPAADEEQFAFIKKVIDDCDYYLLIIGGRYGSTTSEGISYTEKEYDYALERGIKVIALIHENPDEIPAGKSELDPGARGRLAAFREKVKKNRIVKSWSSAEQLPGIVALSVPKTIKTFPAVGWVRGDTASSEELLRELNELRKENDLLRRQVAEYSRAQPPDLEGLAGLDDLVEIKGEALYDGSWHPWKHSITWGEVFALIAPFLEKIPSDATVKGILGSSVFELISSSGRSPTLNDQNFQTVRIQLQAMGLIKTQYTKTTSGGMAFFWSLTPKGTILLYELRTVRTGG